jgi:hypothetical protein
MKKLVKMHINLDESLSKLNNTLNNFLDLDNEDVRVSYLAYYYPYITLKDDIHSWLATMMCYELCFYMQNLMKVQCVCLFVQIVNVIDHDEDEVEKIILLNVLC